MRSETTVRKGNHHTMTSEESPQKKRKVNEDEEVDTKEKEEEKGLAVSTQAAAAGLSLLSGGAPYNRYVYSQSKCSCRIHSS
jgi:hypothetical protein